jgi:hypothetical protein
MKVTALTRTDRSSDTREILSSRLAQDVTEDDRQVENVVAAVRELLANAEARLAWLSLELDARRAPDDTHVVRHLARLESIVESSVPRRLLVAPGATRFRLGTLPAVDLRRKRPARQILDALVRARLATPGEAVTNEVLVEAGWPGEAMHPSSARNRLYVSILVLRKVGLREVLFAQDGGYLLDPTLDVVVG